MVIGTGGCDNVEWGGTEIAIVPPPPKSAPTTGEEFQVGDRLPESPILYYVSRDSLRATVVPVAEVTDDGMAAIEIGDDPNEFGSRFIAAFLREDTELTLFRNGRRAGTLLVDSASVPTGPVCHRLPRATGRLELSGNAGSATEFLAMTRTQAPTGLAIPGDSLRVEPRMQVVGNILAERLLRARRAQLPNWARARRQIQPFPLSEARDAGFTATFLVDDELQVGNDDLGYSLFVVYTPQAQTGYDTAYVAFTNYPDDGKAARRTLDFLDWNRDGSPELLLEVYGTRNSWFEAVGLADDGWDRIFQHRCASPGSATVAADTASGDTVTTTPAAATRQQTPPAQQPAPTSTTPRDTVGPTGP